MPDFVCAYCKAPVRVTSWDLVPSSTPDKYRCALCKRENKLSRRTLFLAMAPSTLLMLAIAATHLLPTSYQLHLDGIWLVVVIVGAYVLGLPIGAWAARRWGKLVEPYGPLL
jgi:hypothetical protein